MEHVTCGEPTRRCDGESTDPERWRRVCAVFAAALRCAPADREALLAAACADDPDLRAAVERLLADAAGPAPDGSGSPRTDSAIPFRPIAEGPGARIGPYKLLQVIGEGGMGIVYLAEQDQAMRRRVALKIIKPGLDTRQVIARFAAERQALAIMDHPHIARVLDAGATDSGRPYFVMELVKGVPITEYCDEHRLAPRARLELFVPVCRAIQHAHQKGVIHRDIKPSNVLVALVDGRPVAKVIDFGVAKAIDQRLAEQTIFTQLGTVVGTLEYMSPEQAGSSSLDVDTRSDVYSLGVLLYELLTGTTPLEREHLLQGGYAEVARRIKEEEPPKPSTRLSGPGERLPAIAARRGLEPARLSRLVRGELDWIAMKALEKDRTRRYETAGALARDIERYLKGQAVEAGPPSARYQLTKFARRHRAALATAGLFAVLLVGGAAVSTYLAIRARAAERLASRRATALAAANGETSRALAEAKQAQARTDAALKESEESRSQAEAVSRFLVESFRKPDPAQDGRTLRVVEVLDQAVSKLEGQFAGSPRIEGELLQALGRTYHGLGLYDKAVQAHARAVSVRRSALGPDHPDTLTSRHDLALGYRRAGRITEAIALHEQTLKLREAKLGSDHPDTLTTRNHLAMCYHEAGWTAQAIALLEPTLKLREATLGSDHLDTLDSRNDLAEAYRAVGRTAEAIALLEQVLKSSEVKLGPDHPDTLISRGNLANAYSAADRTAEAIRMHEQTLQLCEARLGHDHPKTNHAMRDLMQNYYRSGDFERALPYYRKIYQSTLSRDGAQHIRTFLAMRDLAEVYSRLSRYSEAEPLFMKALEGLESRPKDDPIVVLTKSYLANMYAAQQRYDEAEPLLRENLDLVRRRFGQGHPEVAGLLAQLGGNLLMQRKYAAAEPLLRECLAIRAADLPDGWLTFRTRSQLGGSLLGQKKYAEAEPLLLQGYEGMKARETAMPAWVKLELTKAAKRIVVLYDAWSKPGAAALWRARLGLPPAELPADVFAP
jgi:serine/threonine protein kinase